jgi:hypothetical protein
MVYDLYFGIPYSVLRSLAAMLGCWRELHERINRGPLLFSRSRFKIIQ